MPAQLFQFGEALAILLFMTARNTFSSLIDRRVAPALVGLNPVLRTLRLSAADDARAFHKLLRIANLSGWQLLHPFTYPDHIAATAAKLVVLDVLGVRIDEAEAFPTGNDPAKPRTLDLAVGRLLGLHAVLAAAAEALSDHARGLAAPPQAHPVLLWAVVQQLEDQEPKFPKRPGWAARDARWWSRYIRNPLEIAAALLDANAGMVAQVADYIEGNGGLISPGGRSLAEWLGRTPMALGCQNAKKHLVY